MNHDGRVPGLDPKVKEEFLPATIMVNVHGVRYGLGSVSLEVNVWATLAEAAWRDRQSKAELIEEIIVAYLRDRFPERHLPTRSEARYPEGFIDERDEPSDDTGIRPVLKPGVRHYEHDEQNWRRGHKLKEVRDGRG